MTNELQEGLGSRKPAAVNLKAAIDKRTGFDPVEFSLFFIHLKKNKIQGAWLARSGEHGTFDLRVVNPSPALGVGPTFKKMSRSAKY